MMQQVLDIFLHVDKHLDQVVADYGAWVYALLFSIVFAETGLVVTPFLPGDSLLFAVGALAARGKLDIVLVTLLLIVAGILGDAVNYHIGRWTGPKIFRGEGMGLFGRLLNRRHLQRAHEFYERHGGKAVVLGRFVPIVRTFVPYVAGAGAMTYSRFVLFNIAGAVLWVGVCVGAGYAFGNIPVVKNNFSLVVLGIVIVSVMPLALELVKARFFPPAPAAAPATPPPPAP